MNGNGSAACKAPLGAQCGVIYSFRLGYTGTWALLGWDLLGSARVSGCLLAAESRGLGVSG